MKRRFLNADHNPADFARCPHGHPLRQFDMPADRVTGQHGDWVLAYVCDTCEDLATGRDPSVTPTIRVPHLGRLSERRAPTTPASTPIKH